MNSALAIPFFTFSFLLSIGVLLLLCPELPASSSQRVNSRYSASRFIHLASATSFSVKLKTVPGVSSIYFNSTLLIFGTSLGWGCISSAIGALPSGL
ncbi:hypothetical protein DRF59_08815 [Chryseobacterium flavum]|uniref:Uncharacterized protein n=1 Tax=Chryseobacterium flavum TaxID=415851 RepID=A0A3D9CMU1_9FLAO|nr:hypothetical protein DRF59_08815 [Chryseobacterium flavum]